MPFQIRRHGLMALVIALVIGLVPAATASAVDESDSAMVGAEQHALALTNSQRAARGLVKLRPDTRLTRLARERAQYMASTHEFSHTQSGGRDVFDMIDDAGIDWYAAGEIIAWNTAADLDGSAAYAVKGWMGSPSHREIVVSRAYNYVGFGLAIADNGTRYWAGVYLRGPDRTGGYTRIGSFSKVHINARWSRGTVRWSGGDLRLQVLTAGHRYFQVQRRRVGGSWYDYGITRATSVTSRWLRGQVYEFRVRERDRRGNWGAWATKTIRP